MFKKLKINTLLLFIPLTSLVFCFNSPRNDDDKMSTIMVSVKNTLSYLHYAPKPINDAYSQDVYKLDGGKPRSAIRNSSYYFRPAISWSDVGGLGFRSYPPGFIHDNKGPSVFTADPAIGASLLAYLNSPSQPSC